MFFVLLYFCFWCSIKTFKCKKFKTTEWVKTKKKVMLGLDYNLEAQEEKIQYNAIPTIKSINKIWKNKQKQNKNPIKEKNCLLKK